MMYIFFNKHNFVIIGKSLWYKKKRGIMSALLYSLYAKNLEFFSLLIQYVSLLCLIQGCRYEFASYIIVMYFKICIYYHCRYRSNGQREKKIDKTVCFYVSKKSSSFINFRGLAIIQHLNLVQWSQSLFLEIYLPDDFSSIHHQAHLTI